MAELIGGEGEIAIVSFDQTSQTGIERRDGFVAQIKAKYPKIAIVDIEYGGGDHLQSAEITKAILQAHPNLKGIFGTNEGAAIGVAIGKKEAKSNIVVVGYDSGADQIAAIKDGTIAGSITQNPVGIGYETVKAAVAAIKGEKVPAHIDTGFYWYDKTNLDDPKIKPDLYN
jgi:ribose transport system substrate-binding protein